jgi:hypothetical protein
MDVFLGGDVMYQSCADRFFNFEKISIFRTDSASIRTYYTMYCGARRASFLNQCREYEDYYDAHVSEALDDIFTSVSISYEASGTSQTTKATEPDIRPTTETRWATRVPQRHRRASTHLELTYQHPVMLFLRLPPRLVTFLHCTTLVYGTVRGIAAFRCDSPHFDGIVCFERFVHDVGLVHTGGPGVSII